MAGERISVRFMAITGDRLAPCFQLIDDGGVLPESLNCEEIERRFRLLVESNEQIRQVAVFWEATSCIIACEAIKESHRPRELVWLHRGLAEHINQRIPSMGE